MKKISKGTEEFFKMYDSLFENDSIDVVEITLKNPLTEDDIEEIVSSYNRPDFEFEISIEPLGGTTYKVAMKYIG